MNGHLAEDSRGYLCTNSLHTLIAAWLNASQRRRDGVRLNRSGKSALINREDLLLRFIRTYLYVISSLVSI